MAKLSMEYLGSLASLSYASGWAGEAKGSYFLTNIIINVYFTFNNYVQVRVRSVMKNSSYVGVSSEIFRYQKFAG